MFQLLDERSAIVDPPEPVRLAQGAAALSLRSVGFRYEGAETSALADVSLDVASGELAALVGPSGSGKSTLFSLLLRFYEAQEGELLLDGHPIRDVALADLRRRMALVPQDIFLFSGSVAENIRLARPGAAEADVRAAAEAAGAASFIERLDNGFETEVGERGVRLSAGQRQRIAIARAFLRDPQILLLDEATSSLDPDSEATVQRAIEQLLKGRTTIVIAHRLATARRAGRIHVLDQGRIVAAGSHEDLYETNELYRRYWLLQSLEREAPGGGFASPRGRLPTRGRLTGADGGSDDPRTQSTGGGLLGGCRPFEGPETVHPAGPGGRRRVKQGCCCGGNSSAPKRLAGSVFRPSPSSFPGP